MPHKCYEKLCHASLSQQQQEQKATCWPELALQVKQIDMRRRWTMWKMMHTTSVSCHWLKISPSKNPWKFAYLKTGWLTLGWFSWVSEMSIFQPLTVKVYTVKSRFNEWPRSAHFGSLNRDFTLNWDFLMWNWILVTRFHTLNRDFTLNRD